VCNKLTLQANRSISDDFLNDRYQATARCPPYINIWTKTLLFERELDNNIISKKLPKCMFCHESGSSGSPWRLNDCRIS